MATLPPIATILDPLGFLEDLTSLAETNPQAFTVEETTVYRQLITDVRKGTILAADTLPQSEALANDLVDRIAVTEQSMLRIYDRYSVPPPPPEEIEAARAQADALRMQRMIELSRPHDPDRI